MYDLTQIEVIMLTSFMDVTHEKYTNNRITKGSYNIVVFLTICISYTNNCFTL